MVTVTLLAIKEVVLPLYHFLRDAARHYRIEKGPKSRIRNKMKQYSFN